MGQRGSVLFRSSDDYSGAQIEKKLDCLLSLSHLWEFPTHVVTFPPPHGGGNSGYYGPSSLTFLKSTLPVFYYDVGGLFMANTRKFDIADIINEIGDEVDDVLNKKRHEKYLEKLLLLYSLTENLLRWTLFFKVLWEQSSTEIPAEVIEKWEAACRGMNLYNSVNMAMATDLIDFKTYIALDKLRKNRNLAAHQLWIYVSRNNPRVLEKELRDTRKLVKKLVKRTVCLVQEIGTEDITKYNL